MSFIKREVMCTSVNAAVMDRSVCVVYKAVR